MDIVAPPSRNRPPKIRMRTTVARIAGVAAGTDLSRIVTGSFRILAR